MTSEAQAGLQSQDDEDTRPETAGEPEASTPPAAEPATSASDAAPGENAAENRGRWRRRDAGDDGDVGEPSSRRISLPLVPLLAGLLVLLLAGTAFLWFTRPTRSSVGTGNYVQVLEAARSEIVDLTSFDYVTLDEDIARIKRVSIGDLQKESVAQLDKQRQQLSQAQAVVNTEVIGAGVTRSTSSDATVLLVIQSTQKSAASPQAQVVRYRIEAHLEKVHDKWLLAGITGR